MQIDEQRVGELAYHISSSLSNFSSLEMMGDYHQGDILKEPLTVRAWSAGSPKNSDAGRPFMAVCGVFSGQPKTISAVSERLAGGILESILQKSMAEWCPAVLLTGNATYIVRASTAGIDEHSKTCMPALRINSSCEALGLMRPMPQAMAASTSTSSTVSVKEAIEDAAKTTATTATTTKMSRMCVGLLNDYDESRDTCGYGHVSMATLKISVYGIIVNTALKSGLQSRWEQASCGATEASMCTQVPETDLQQLNETLAAVMPQVYDFLCSSVIALPADVYRYSRLWYGTDRMDTVNTIGRHVLGNCPRLPPPPLPCSGSCRTTPNPL